ncbi:MAG TPA: DnaJ domain-containing protein [Spirochaetia bacterium]|nr:DnaJ domain-containing protein [Spirochaetia bacterium]
MISIREDSLTDYYAILELEPSASVQDIKRSFRKKVKEQHPDLLKNPGDSQKNIRVLIQAYKTLSDPTKREEYNRTHRIFKRSPADFDYREFLKARADDLDSQAKLIFFDLLHRHEDEALILFDRLVREEGFELDRYLDREDYMDCSYLLSEEYEKEGEFGRAYELLRSISEYEFELPYFKHFFYEVERRVQSLICYKMIGTTVPEYHLACIEELAALAFPKKMVAQALKTGAELLIRLGNHSEALHYLNRGMELDPKLKGVAKLQQRIFKQENALSVSE